MGEKPNISIRLRPEIIDALNRISNRKKTKRANVIREIIENDDEIKQELGHDERTARFCHKMWNVHRVIDGHDPDPDWDDLDEEDKKTALWGVKIVRENPGIVPKEFFSMWKERKTRDDWKFGKSRDRIRKTHPCIIDDYDDLPKEEKTNYLLFIGVVKESINYH